MTFDELLSLCREAWTAEGLSDKTIHAYLLVIRRAEVALRVRDSSVCSATALEIRELADGWPRTRSSRIQLRTALARVWEIAERVDPPLAAVRVPTKPRYHCRALDDPQAAALARVARADRGPAGLAVLLGLYAGLRRAEIATLRFDNVRGDWLVFVGKMDVTREVPIHPVLAGRLDARRQRAKSPFVFPGDVAGHVNPTTVWTWSRRLGLEALGVPVSTHILRHTAIATLNDRTRDLRAAQHFAGHASPETTVIYTRVSRDRLIEAVSMIGWEDVK